jgi:hypothetical protein
MAAFVDHPGFYTRQTANREGAGASSVGLYQTPELKPGQNREAVCVLTAAGCC